MQFIWDVILKNTLKKWEIEIRKKKVNKRINEE